MKEFETLEIKNKKELTKWLKSYHDKSLGFFLKIGKGEYARETISYQEALEIALAFGWIDSQKLPFDEKHWLQRFGPRKEKSMWSKRNKEIVEKLINENKMELPGLKAVEIAKKNGTWDRAYSGQSTMEIPEDLLALLEKDKEAKDFFESLDKKNKYAIIFRIQNVKKSETKKAKMELYINMLHNHQKLHN